MSVQGKNNPNWKGGVTPLNEKIRKCLEYKIWRRKGYERDNFTCQICSQKGYKLSFDHIKPFSVIMEENNITTFEQALNCQELWDLSNGRTLCFKCHTETDTYGLGVYNYKKHEYQSI